VAEQRYQAVLAVIGDGLSVSQVAEKVGVSRQTLHSWLARYEARGLEGLVDRSHRPARCPHQMPAAVDLLRATTTVSSGARRLMLGRSVAGLRGRSPHCKGHESWEAVVPFLHCQRFARRGSAAPPVGRLRGTDRRGLPP
jgi:transposase-like protein